MFHYRVTCWPIVSLITLFAVGNLYGGDRPIEKEKESAREEAAWSLFIRSQMKQWQQSLKIREALEQDTSLEFIETPLQDVVDFLEDRHNIEIELDTRALDVMGIGSDTPVTRELRGVTLGFALKLMLRDLDLTYQIDEEVVLITSREKADRKESVRIFAIGDLTDDDKAMEKMVTAARVAANLDLDQVAAFRDRLIVRGTRDDFRNVERLLIDLRGHASSQMDHSRHPLDRWPLGKNVNLSGRVSDADLPYLKAHKQIGQLDISKSSVSDDGLALIRDMPELEVLLAGGTRITDGGLAHLKQMKKLKVLDLMGTGVTDKGLAEIASLKSLKILSIGNSQRHLAKVSKKAVDGLKKSLPGCQIHAYYYQPRPMGESKKPKPAADDDPFGGGAGRGDDPFGVPDDPFGS